MAALPGIIIKIGADTTDAIQGINRTEAALGRQLSTGEKFNRMYDTMRLAFIGAGVAAGAFAIKLGVDAVNAAVEDEKSVAALNRTMDNLGFANRAAEADQFISKLQGMYGVADTDLRPAFDRLLRSTRDVGEAERLLQISMDASAGTGKSLQAIADSLGKAYDGNTGSLGKLGLGIDAATLKSGNLELITGRMAETFGGQAATQAATFSGQLNILGEAAGEASEQVGHALLRAITGLNKELGGSGGAAEALDSASDSLSDFIDGVGVALQELARLKGNTGSITDSMEGFAGIIRNTTQTWFPFTRGVFDAVDGFLNLGPAAVNASNRVANAANVASIAGQRYIGLANSIAAANAAMNNQAVASRYTALAVQEFDQHISYSGGNLYEYMSSLDDVADSFGGGGGGGGSLASAIDKVNPRITAQTALTQRHIEKLGILRDRVAELVQEQQAYITATAAQISGGISFSAVFDSENVATSIEAFRKQIGDVASFSTALAGLASRIGTSPGAQALLAQIQGLGAANGNAVLKGMTDEVAIGLAGDLNTALGTINGNASVMGTVFYQEGINGAVALMDSMAVQVAKDEEKLKAIGRQIGAPIGAEIRAAVAAALQEAMAASAGVGAAAAGAAAAASVTSAATVIINGATVIDPTNVARAISTAQVKARARTGGGP